MIIIEDIINQFSDLKTVKDISTLMKKKIMSTDTEMDEWTNKKKKR